MAEVELDEHFRQGIETLYPIEEDRNQGIETLYPIESSVLPLE